MADRCLLETAECGYSEADNHPGQALFEGEPRPGLSWGNLGPRLQVRQSRDQRPYEGPLLFGLLVIIDRLDRGAQRGKWIL